MSTSDQIGLWSITGALEPRPTNLVDVSGNLNLRRSEDRQRYNRLLLHSAQKTEVGESLGFEDSDLRATPPSWTQSKISKEHAFVIPAYSSSYDEIANNVYVSGSFPLESTSVAASASVYYGKRRLVTKTYYLTGSDNYDFAGVNYATLTDITGTFFGGDNFPAYLPPFNRLKTGGEFGPHGIQSGDGNFFQIDVPDNGKLVDIKVWVEIVTKFSKESTAGNQDDFFNTCPASYTASDEPNPINVGIESFFIQMSQSMDLSCIGIYLIPPLNGRLYDSHGPRYAWPGWNCPEGHSAIKAVDTWNVMQNILPGGNNAILPQYPFMGDPNSVNDIFGTSVRDNTGAFKTSVWDGTYILWEGKLSFTEARDWTYGRNLSQSFAGGFVRFVPGSSSIFRGTNAVEDAYVNWDTDFNIRTVFCDSSPNKNPLHLEDFYNFNSSSLSKNPVTVLSGGSPNEAGLKIYKQKFYGVPLTASAYGRSFPWFMDDRLKDSLGSISSASTPITGWNDIGFPPRGWLNGSTYIVSSSYLGSTNKETEDFDYANTLIAVSGFQGGQLIYSASDDYGGSSLWTYQWIMHSASENEWPTKGRNLGPETIKPVLPLLDDIYSETVYRHPLSIQNYPTVRRSGTLGIQSTMNENVILRGFRPGLRGIEISGSWQLLVTIPTDSYNGAWIHHGYYFRQYRLELTYEQGEGVVASSLSSKEKRFRTSTEGRRPGKNLIHVMSGSRLFPFHFGVEKYYVIEQDAYGRSIGISSDTGSVGDFSVFSRITGSLSDRLTGSAGVFQNYLNNEFGTPYIPVSSGSGVPMSSQNFTSEAEHRDLLLKIAEVRDTIVSKTEIPPANTLKSVISRGDYFLTTEEKTVIAIEEMEKKIASLTSSGSV